MTAKSFNQAATSSTPLVLTQTVEIGWEHEVIESESGQSIVFRLDDAGQRVPRRYTVPARLTARETLHRAQGIPRHVAEKLANGDLEGVIDVLDALIGGGVVESIGTDPTVSTVEFMEFLDYMVGELRLADVFGSPGN